MGILAFFGSVLVFMSIALAALFILIRISSRLAVLVLLLVPILSVLILPETTMAFLAYEHFRFVKGLVTLNNFHILLIMWSTLIGIIVYTEFLTWYLTRKGTDEQIEE